ncbi:hypothetical protein N9I73_01635, partial [Porticoccaceae bacterium]|nr:hypothetical protein [Porticoccaceae bacterium]
TTALTWDGQESVTGDCAFGEWGDRQVNVVEDDITLDVVLFGSCTDAAPVMQNVTFQVDMSAVDTVNAGGVYLAGGTFGDAGQVMEDQGNGLWTKTVELVANNTYQYKFRNADTDGWEAVVGLVAGECNVGDWDDRFVVVTEADITLPVVAFGSCTDQPYVVVTDPDTDGDGVADSADAFPNDASETADSDNDGVGDNADYAPNDPSVTEAPAQPDQLVSVKGDPSASIGGSVDLVIEYNVSDNNANLSGLGVSVHYDSSSLTFTGFADVLAADNISSDGPFNDDEDLDGNPATDKYVSGAWASLFSSWPGVLPTELLTLSFDVADPVTGDTTPIGFSSVSNAAGYDFAPEAYDMPFSSGSWDFDEDGKADALTDGLMLLRYTFNLRDTALTSGAISSGSALTAAEVEANVAEAASSFADIDGSGNVDALTDGLLLLRYLFNLRDDALVAGAIASGAERSSSADVEAYIISLMP